MPASSDVTLFDTDCIVCGVDAVVPLKYSSTTRRPLRRTSSDVIDLYAPPRMRPTSIARRLLSRPSASGAAEAHSAVDSTGVRPPTGRVSVGPAGIPPHAAETQTAASSTRRARGLTAAANLFRAALLRSLPLFVAVAAQHVGDGFVPLVAGVLVDQLVLQLQRNHHRPRLRPRRRILDGDLVLEDVLRDARIAFGEPQVLVRPHEVALGREVRALH